MSTDISISISARDNFSSAITTIKNACNSFKKDVTDLQNKLDMLNKNKITLKVETDKAKSDLKEAEKAFKALGDAAGDEQVKALQAANEGYEQARRNLSLVSREAKNTEKDILNLKGAITKADNSGGNSFLSKFVASGAHKLIGDTASNIVSGFAESAYGSNGSTMVSSMLSGATSGLAAGTMMGNPLVGLVGGLTLGIVNGITSIEKNKDSSFKSVVQSSFESAMQAQNETQLRGSSIAGNREMRQVQFENLLGRIQTMDKADLTDLNSLMDNGIPVWDYLAEASGKTKEDVQEMVSEGLVPGAEAAKTISDYMGISLEGSMKKQSETFVGLMSSLEEAQSEIDSAMGEGYNEERKKGIQEQIDYFEGESGEKIKEANRMIGEWKASLENDREAAIRRAMDEMLKSDEYIKAEAEGNRVKMGALLAEAQVKGENEYKAGDKAQLQLDTEKELVQRIRNHTALQEEYWNAGLVMGEEFSKGRAAAIQAADSDFEPSHIHRKKRVHKGKRGYSKNAYGLNYVPYDDFPALLHQGERVLTASENRSSKTIPQVNITGNEFNVRSDDDIERIGDVLVKKLITAYEVM